MPGPRTSKARILALSGGYGAVLIISVGQGKLKRLSGERLYSRLRELAAALRAQPGVRYIECIVFQDWKDGGNPKASANDAPWKPYGAVVSVEAEDTQTLQRYIDNLWRVAEKVDQEMVVTAGVDNW